MNNNISVIILAAGQGTRMKSKTPKVLHKISGKQMLFYAIREAKKLSDDIHIVLYHQASLVQETMESYFQDLNFHIQDHENYPGTGGAVMGIIPKNKKALVLNGDMPLVEADELSYLICDEPLTMSVL
jgi:bifunctional UDP-N-acetylglucosamine pyrophosphorylase/glucosamine-1-phosphate N-acetyltransferase